MMNWRLEDCEKLEDQQPVINIIVKYRKVCSETSWLVATWPKYCQLVRDRSKEMRLEWCKKIKDEQFENVVWKDECSVQLDIHGRLCFCNKGHQRKFKPWPKHLIKVHIWGGISHCEATQLVLFTGTMTATRYCSILELGLLPFLEEVFPISHRFQQDNNPKHTSNFVKIFLKTEVITGGKNQQRVLIWECVGFF